VQGLVSASLPQHNLFSCRRFLVELLPTAFPVGVKFRACLEAGLVRLVRKKKPESSNAI
jgi:hypothetical protein